MTLRLFCLYRTPNRYTYYVYIVLLIDIHVFLISSAVSFLNRISPGFEIAIIKGNELQMDFVINVHHLEPQNAKLP